MNKTDKTNRTDKAKQTDRTDNKTRNFFLNGFLLWGIFLAALLGGGLMSCEQKLSLDKEENKISYAIGRQLGESLKSHPVKLDMPTLTLAIKEAYTGKKPALSPQEMRAAVNAMIHQSSKLRSEEAKVHEGEAKKFLEENKKKKGIVTLPSGLQYRVLKKGKGKSPSAKDRVKVHYTGKLINGTVFDSSRKRGTPATFGVRQVVSGWTEALQKMKKGSQWELFIPPQLGYGAKGQGQIPPNALLIFDMELLSVEKSGK